MPVQKARPWLKNQPPRRASALELLLLFAVALAGVGGCLALLFAFSLRDVRLERPGAALTVAWRFCGVRFWQEHWPRIVSVEQRDVRMPRESGAIKLDDDIITQVVFRDAPAHEALILRRSSLYGRVPEMQAWLTAAEPAVLELEERERWWTVDRRINLFWCFAGLIVGVPLSAFLLVGACSALWVQLRKA